MKSRNNFKKKNNHYYRDQEEIRIKERKRLPKKLRKQNIYDLIEEEKMVDHVDLYATEGG